MTTTLTPDEAAFVEVLRGLTSVESWAPELMLAPDGWYRGMELCRHEDARMLAWMDVAVAGRVVRTVGVFARAGVAYAGEVHNQLFEWAPRHPVTPLTATGDVTRTASEVHLWLASVVARPEPLQRGR